MNESERKQVRSRIHEDIAQLEKDIPHLEEQSKPVAPDNAIGRLSRMEAINSKSVAQATLRNATLRLTQLKQILGKLDDPEFGLCRECDEAIPLKRILAMPEKNLCIECAQLRGQ